jgi:hypothetical protein
MNKINGPFWSVESDLTLNEKNQVELAKSALEANSRTLSAVIFGISIIAGAWILGSKLKKEEED